MIFVIVTTFFLPFILAKNVKKSKTFQKLIKILESVYNK
ncbi:hypothetical protein STRDD11_01880 [Streptococcus sp. DD11]|nr:hypothetical protein STRDD11_01880 [Streptococcus sp. DD11]